MSENLNFKKSFIDSLNQIEHEELSLLTQKAKLLEKELFETNLKINNSQNSSVDDLISSSLTEHNRKHRLKNSFKSNFHPNLLSKKHLLIFSSILFASLIVSIGIGEFLTFDNRVLFEKPLKSKFVIENLRGDTINTMKSWRILPDDELNVNLINGNVLTDEQFDAVVNVISSTDSIELDDHLLNKGQIGSMSTYYLGWAGAMIAASSVETTYTIPTNYNIFQSSNGEGHIVIDFTNYVNADGFSGYARSVLEDGEILKSHITIYDVENLEPSELATIVRHEFGHALGLGHSTDPEDLMAPTILTEFPYISECNVDAMRILYDGNESSLAVCEK